uniref:SHSP domain-containing protein n=1 Tax=Meloidogyne hapla TaxID=6305 RepID=A0A1I8BCR0_MELHA
MSWKTIPVKFDSFFDWKRPLHLFDEFRSTKKHGDFEVEIDVNGFDEREIELPATKLTFTACMKEKVDTDFLTVNYILSLSIQDSSQTVKNEISRSYVLPTDVDPDSVKSKLSDRGILTVIAYKKA